MTNANTFSRRGFLEAVAALSSLGVAACAAVPQQTGKLPDADRKTRKLPPRGEFVVRNAYLVTMDARLGDIPVGDADRTDATGKILFTRRFRALPPSRPRCAQGPAALEE